jgi:hypothetical protein
MGGSDEEKIDSLFLAYRDACVAPAPGVNFMPNLWARIESRQSFTFSFRRMANAFVTAAVALSIAAGVYLSIPRADAVYYSQSYVEALAEAASPDLVGPASLDATDLDPDLDR